MTIFFAWDFLRLWFLFAFVNVRRGVSLKNKRLLVHDLAATNLTSCWRANKFKYCTPLRLVAKGVGEGSNNFLPQKTGGCIREGGGLIGDLQYFYRFRIHQQSCACDYCYCLLYIHHNGHQFKWSTRKVCLQLVLILFPFLFVKKSLGS